MKQYKQGLAFESLVPSVCGTATFAPPKVLKVTRMRHIIHVGFHCPLPEPDRPEATPRQHV